MIIIDHVMVIYWSTSASTVRNLFFGVDVTAREKARNVYKSTREVQVMNKANILSISTGLCSKQRLL